jgi:hypothetical protein
VLCGIKGGSLDTNSGDRAKKTSSKAWNRDRSQSSPFDVKARTIFRIAVKAAGKPSLLRYSFYGMALCRATAFDKEQLAFSQKGIVRHTAIDDNEVEVIVRNSFSSMYAESGAKLLRDVSRKLR